MRSLNLLPRLLSRADAAFYCGVSTGHFVTYVAPAVRTVFVHQKCMYDRESIDRWIEGRQQQAAAPEPTDDELIAVLG